MPRTLDLPTMRQFADDLNARLRRCDNGEGMVCSTLDESIGCYVNLCEELRDRVNEWAHAIFTGHVAFDPAVEKLLKDEVKLLADRAKPVAAQGRAKNWQCYELRGLNALHFYVADFDYLLANWVSPQPAVAPSPRVTVPEAAARQVEERLAQLYVLPGA